STRSGPARGAPYSGNGLESLAIMTAFGALLVLGGRSETIRGLRGDGRDERFRLVDVHVTELAGLAMITAIIIELANVHVATLPDSRLRRRLSGVSGRGRPGDQSRRNDRHQPLHT